MGNRNPEIIRNLKVNYGIFFKEVLRSFGLQSRLYDYELNITKNIWNSMCEGRNFSKQNETVSIICDKTGIDAQVLKAKKRMFLEAGFENDDQTNEEKNLSDSDLIKKINEFIEEVKDNPQIAKEIVNQKYKENEKLATYNRDFLKLVRYALLLSGRYKIDPDEKVKQATVNLKKMNIQFFELADFQYVNEYFEELQKHIKIIEAVKTIKEYKKEKF